jgi:hypothetical protein
MIFIASITVAGMTPIPYAADPVIAANSSSPLVRLILTCADKKLKYFNTRVFISD